MKINPGQKIIIYYFSGTGNTQIVARKIAETFIIRGLTATLINIENIDKISISDNDVIGIGFPVAGFTTYPIVFNFLQKFDKVNGNYVFAFDTMGGTSLWGIMGKLKTILEIKGFRTLGFREFTMPPNIFVKFPEKWRRARIAKSFKRAEDFVDKLLMGDLRWKKTPLLSEVMYIFSHALFSITEYKWHQKYLKIKVNISMCNSCGICSSKCPVKNIYLKAKAEIGEHCQYCFRCVGVCPSKAISGIASPRSLHYLAEGARF